MNIIITGAGKGIGIELVKKYAEHAENNILAISRNIVACQNLGKKNVNAFSYDLKKLLEGDDRLIKNIFSEFEHVDILINNAGVLYKQDFDKSDFNQSREMFDVNFFVPAILIKNLLPLFGTKNKSHIVNIGSMGGYQTSEKFPGLSMYSASKAALAVLTECLSVEINDVNVSCNCLALGSAQTEMFEMAFPGLKASVNPEQMAEYIYKFSLNGQFENNGAIIPVVFNDF